MDPMLLLFQGSCPCWDVETVALTGEDPSVLDRLESSGFIVKEDLHYILTDKGTAARDLLSREMGVPIVPFSGVRGTLALWRNRLNLLLDRAFVGRWGIKDFSIGESFPVVPSLPRERLYRIDPEGIVRYIWDEDPLIADFKKSFPHWGVAAREYEAPGQTGLDRWMSDRNLKASNVVIDLFLRSGYDFKYYSSLDTLKTDRFKFQNVDRLFCLKVDDSDNLGEVLYKIGQIQIFLLGQKRVYIPGWSDIDSAEQENWTMILLVADDEEHILKVKEKLEPSGKNLIDPVRPLFLLGTSLEKLRSLEKPRETIYDWFCYDVHYIARPDTD